MSATVDYAEPVAFVRLDRIISATMAIAVHTFSTAWASRLMLILNNGLYKTAVKPNTHGHTGRDRPVALRAIQTA